MIVIKMEVSLKPRNKVEDQAIYLQGISKANRSKVSQSKGVNEESIFSRESEKINLCHLNLQLSLTVGKKRRLIQITMLNPLKSLSMSTSKEQKTKTNRLRFLLGHQIKALQRTVVVLLKLIYSTLWVNQIVMAKIRIKENQNNRTILSPHNHHKSNSPPHLKLQIVQKQISLYKNSNG